MRKRVENIINKHKGKTAIVFGNGPSSRPHIKMYERISRNKSDYVFLACNTHHKMIDTETDYWFVCNPQDTVNKRFPWFNTKPKSTLVYADSVDLTNKNVVDKVLECDYIPFDQRHFGGKKCHVCSWYHCDKFFDPNRLTIQERLKEYTKSDVMYSSGDSVILHASAFAIIMGCDPLYVVGVDLDYSDPYLNNDAKTPLKKDGFMAECKENIIRDFGVIKKMADNIGVKIYTTVDNGNLSRSLPHKMIKEKKLPNWRSCTKEPGVKSHSIVPTPKHFTEYVKDEKLGELLEGKRVALVGPAPNLIGYNTGYLLDGVDVVVRTGIQSKLPEELHKDYGSRTDILVHSFNKAEIQTSLKNMDYLSTMKYIICAMVSAEMKKQHEGFFNKIRSRGVPVHKPEDTYLYKMFREVGTVCNIGFGAIILLLKYNLKELYVTGQTFYNMGEFGATYLDQYYDEISTKNLKKNKSKTVYHNSARFDIHNQKAQIDYFSHLIDLHDELKLDAYLTREMDKWRRQG